jgi:hypothetical protein
MIDIVCICLGIVSQDRYRKGDRSRVEVSRSKPVEVNRFSSVACGNRVASSTGSL